MRKLIVLATTLVLITSTLVIGNIVNATTEQERLLNLINNYRQSNGLQVLTARNDVAGVAAAHSKNMHDQNNLNHVLDGKSPSDRLNDAGIGYTAMCENVAFNKGYSNPVQTCFDGWVNSPGHNANMLSSSVTHAGIGIYYSDVKGWWFTFMGIKPTGDNQSDPGEGDEEEEEDSQDINLTLKQGASSSYSITFTNTGTVALTMKTIIVSGSKWVVATPTTVTIPAGKKQIFAVKISAFSDMTPGKYTDTVKFSWNGGASNYVINLTVIQNPDLVKPDFQIVGPDSLAIPFEQGAWTSVSLTVKNTGTTEINPVVSAYGNYTGLLKLFPNSNPKTGTIKPGKSATINIGGIMMLKTTSLKSAIAYFTFTEKTIKKTLKITLSRGNSPMFSISGPQLIKMDFIGKSKTFNYSITNTGKTKSTFDIGIWFDDYDFLTIDYLTTADETPVEAGKTVLLKVTINLLKKPTVSFVGGYIQCNKTGDTTKKNLEFKLMK